MLQASNPHLSRPEWAAVSLALIEADKGGHPIPPPPGSLRARMDRVLTALTGIDRSQPLANPRLEAVRRFVWATRRQRRAADEYVPDLLEQGFNSAQIEALALLSA